jgi:hypothetical protein
LLLRRFGDVKIFRRKRSSIPKTSLIDSLCRIGCRIFLRRCFIRSGEQGAIRRDISTTVFGSSGYFCTKEDVNSLLKGPESK